MKLIFRQRFFSWLDSYDIYDETGRTAYTVQGQLAWGHCLKIFDGQGRYLGMVKERVLTFLPKFEIYLGNDCLGCIRKELTLFQPRFHIDCCGWDAQGSFLEWDYTITGPQGEEIARITKELFRMTDTYVIDVARPENALCALMLVLAIDAEKCSRQ